MPYVIKENGKYWSSILGWTDLQNATIHTNIPVGDICVIEVDIVINDAVKNANNKLKESYNKFWRNRILTKKKV